ncbi:phage capsid protein [Alphaproteobacteria bacterium]|nr:phage capsid protein [Alphaproteobacteria bacterium]
MSTQINTAFVNQFSANVTMLSQQMGSLLRGTVDTETVNGEKAFFDQVGSAAAAVRTTRHADTPMMETPHSRRMVTLQDFEYADLIDDQDKIRMLSDPTSVYAKAAAAGIGRAMDDVIITAFNASASTGKSGSTSTAFPAGNIVAHGSAGLTVAKLISAKKILDQNSVDPSINRYIVVSPEQIEDLLNTTSVTSSDFNTVKALATGTVDSFVGFKFIVSNRLKDDGTSRQCYAWAEDGMKLAVGKEPSAQITQRADKSYATQVYYCASFGATRMEEAKVVQVLCNE